MMNGNPQKKTSSSGKSCIIHCSDSKETLTKLQSHDSWKVLLKAAQIRKYQPILELVENLSEDEVPNILYHRRCRSIFTLKSTLDQIQEQEKVPKEKEKVSVLLYKKLFTPINNYLFFSFVNVLSVEEIPLLIIKLFNYFLGYTFSCTQVTPKNSW